MKTIYKSLFMLLVCSITIICEGQETNQPPAIYKEGSPDYWQAKMRESGLNYHEFKNEFDNYWAGKIPVKGSGYKQIRRWLIEKSAYVNPDGSIRLPQEDIDNAMAYNQSNTSFAGNWSYVGPNQPIIEADNGTTTAANGRVTAIGFNPFNDQTVYVGSPLGGLWVSYNNGSTYQNMNTDEITSLGVSAVAVDPTDPNIIFIGTGDRDTEVTLGKGIYKSSDGGLTWVAKPLSPQHDKYVCKILFDPANHNKMVVASNYGIYVSHDNGNTWSNKLAVYLKDMEQKPGEPYTLYAVSNNTFYKSVNFGETWQSMLTTSAHRIAISTTPDNPEKVIMFTSRDSHFHRIYVSENSGESFYLKNNVTGIPEEGQGWYNLDFIIDPLNEDIMYAGMVNFYKSTDGGTTWVNQVMIYADDQHTFEFHPVTHRLFIGNDSGIWYSDDGITYTYSSNGLNVTEIYRMDVASQNPSHIIMGNQDAATFVSNGGSYYRSIGGDGGTCKFDPTNENYVFGSSQNGHVARSVNGGVLNASFSTIAANGSHGINEEANFITSFLVDYFNSNRMFYGAKSVWRSSNIKTSNPANVTFTKISPNLGGTSQTIEFIEQSRANQNILYIALSNGKMYRTDMAQAVSPSWYILPNPTDNDGGNVRFKTHEINENIVYMIKGNRIYKSLNKGQTWINLTEDLTGLGIMSVAYMHGSPEGLYIGTTAGVYFKDSTMTDWVPFKSGIPLTQVKDLVINYSTTPAQLFAASFGRGIWKTTIMATYVPDLSTGTGNATISGTNVSSVNPYYTSASMVTIPSCSIGYYLSANESITSADHLISRSTLNDLYPGLILQIQLPLTDVAAAVPELESGSYYFGMKVDDMNEIDETSEANNTWVATSMVTIPANPASPVNVQASDGTFQDKVTITWENNTGEPLYYAVFRYNGPFPNTMGAVQITPATWISTTSFDDFTGENGTTYYYWVKSSRYPSGIRGSDFSISDHGWKALNPPMKVQASDGQFGDRVTITWPSVSGATNYRVYRSAFNMVNETMFISGTTWIYDTIFNDMTAAYGTTYYYWVRASKSQWGSYASGYSAANTGWVGFVTAPDVTATDGTYTNKVNLNWNTVNNATHYMLYRNTVNEPETASAITGWQTALTYSDITAATGTVYYYWVQAAQDPAGNIVTGFGNVDSGFSNYVAPTNVIAADGADTRYTQVTWQSSPGATWYKVYRGVIPSLYSAISSWRNSLLFRDATGTPGVIYYYSVRASGDTNVVISSLSTENDGFRKISAPKVDATIGIFPDKVALNWQASDGATYYLIQRSTIENPTVKTTLSGWSNTMNYQFDDLTAVLNQRYNYYVTGAVNSSGLRAGNTGQATGMAGTCGNLVDDPAYRSINLHGTTLELTQRLINTGPHPLLNPGQITINIENATPNGSPEAVLGTVIIPPLATGASYDFNYTIDLSTIPGFTFTYGTWHVTFNLSCDNGNCDSYPSDNYLIWQNPVINYTDAMHGIYTIGPSGCDFKSPARAVESLILKGISDPVIFHLTPYEYGEKLVFTGITGASVNKTIKFMTNPTATDTAIIVGIPNETDNYTLKFQNCSYMTFENLKISTLGSSNFLTTYGRVIDIGSGCHDLKFRFNQIVGFTDDSHISSDNSVIYCSNVSSSNLLFEGNTILNGAWGMYFSGIDLTTGPIVNLQIIKNLFSRFLRGGIDLADLDHPIISGNVLIQENAAESIAEAISIINVRNGFDISGNKIHLTGNADVYYGMALMEMNMDGGQPGLISNNFISLGSSSSNNYGLSFSSCHKTRLLYNTINIYGTPGVFSTGVIIDCNYNAFGYDNSFVNNNIMNQVGGYCLTISENALNFNFLYESDYNNFKTDGPNVILFRGIPMPTIQTWYNETGKDQHSVSLDPAYLSNTDLHCNSQEFDNKGTHRLEVTSDFDGEGRSLTTPDIGADEFTFNPPPKTLNLVLFLEGLYEGSYTMRQAWANFGPRFDPGIADLINVELHSASDYNNIVHTAYHINLGTNGQAIVSIPGALNGSYYITIKHRNSILTTTASPVSFASGVIGYSFNSPAKAYGGNLLQMPTGQYVIYGGDVNQDGTVDQTDIDAIYNSSSTFTSGYVPEDANGDGIVDALDMIMTDNNAARFTVKITP